MSGENLFLYGQSNGIEERKVMREDQARYALLEYYHSKVSSQINIIVTAAIVLFTFVQASQIVPENVRSFYFLVGLTSIASMTTRAICRLIMWSKISEYAFIVGMASVNETDDWLREGKDKKSTLLKKKENKCINENLSLDTSSILRLKRSIDRLQGINLDAGFSRGGEWLYFVVSRLSDITWGFFPILLGWLSLFSGLIYGSGVQTYIFFAGLFGSNTCVGVIRFSKGQKGQLV